MRSNDFTMPQSPLHNSNTVFLRCCCCCNVQLTLKTHKSPLTERPRYHGDRLYSHVAPPNAPLQLASERSTLMDGGLRLKGCRHTRCRLVCRVTVADRLPLSRHSVRSRSPRRSRQQLGNASEVYDHDDINAPACCCDHFNQNASGCRREVQLVVEVVSLFPLFPSSGRC